MSTSDHSRPTLDAHWQHPTERPGGEADPDAPPATRPAGSGTSGEPPTTDDSQPGVESIGGFRILRECGRGGMGVVYQAEQADPPRPVALKVLAPDRRADPASLARFRTEVRVAGRLHHTNIVPVFGTVAGADGPTAYAMPFIPGDSLAAVARALRGGGAASPTAAAVVAQARTDRGRYARSAVEWVRQAAEAVAATHAAGVVHRDVKPGNLLLEIDRTGRPHVWLTDFGLAVADGDSGVGEPPSGTPGYRSPEQAAGGGAGAATDVYALGVTLAELLTLDKPTDARPVGDCRRLPGELRRVVARATAPHPADRYPSAAALADDLTRFLAGQPVRAGRPGWAREAAHWAARHRRPITAAALAFVLTAVVAVALLARAYAAEREARLASAEARRAVAATTLTMDDILYATPGKLDADRAMLEQAVRVQELQLAVEPGDLSATRHLAHASWRLSRVYSRGGRAGEAVAAARRAVALYLRVAAADPGEPLHRLDAARSYSVLALAHRSAVPPDEGAALAADADALHTARALAADFPHDVRVLDAMGTYTTGYASGLKDAGKVDEAAALYRDAIAVAERCRAREPRLWRLASPEMNARTRLAQLLAARGRPADALAENATALALCDDLLTRAAAEGEPDRLELLSFRLSQVELLADRGWWLVATGRDAAAAAADLAAASERLAGEHPDRADGGLGVAHLRAWTAFRSGRPRAAEEAGREYERLLLARPDCPTHLTLLSRYYADGPGERDPGKAERAARAALRLPAATAAARLALAIALYRQGRLDECAAELSAVADPPHGRTVGLVRAAVAARRGRADDARNLLAAALQSTTACEPSTPDWEAEVRRAVAGRAD